jgi:hypothetical protein
MIARLEFSQALFIGFKILLGEAAVRTYKSDQKWYKPGLHIWITGYFPEV